jgi:lipoate---protein ligase
MSWRVARHNEPAALFHARTVAQATDRQVWVCEVTGPALVLGSTQTDELIDRAACDRRGIDVVRRRSGGGAVLVVPGHLLWVDVIVPAGDPLWEPDVGTAFVWLGEAWSRALADLGVTATAHRGAMVRSEWSDLVCFAGRGPGEVTLADAAKVVGISQRRTRAGSRFQCAALLRWEPASLLELLALDPPARAAAERDLVGSASGLDVDAGALLGALLSHLP